MAVVVYRRQKGFSALPELPEASPFTDTTSKNVQWAYQLGIIKGRGDGIFDPFAGISREEAAVMLTRLADVLQITGSQESLYFSDTAHLSQESQTAIATISAISDGTKRIMEGMGSQQFAPSNRYTVEQAALTMVRLLQAAKAQK